MSTSTIPQETEKSKKFSILGLIFDALKWTMVFLLVFVCLATIVVPVALGARPTTVLTQSMEPTFDPGDLVMIKDATINEIKINEVAEIQPKSGDPTTYVHRVTSIATGGPKGKILTTQGDNNNAPDEPVKYAEQVKGKLINFPGTQRLYVIPKLGYLREKPMWTLGAAGLLILLALVSFAGEDKAKKKAEKEKIRNAEEERAELEELRLYKEGQNQRELEELRKFKESHGSTVASAADTNLASHDEEQLNPPTQKD